MDEEKSSEKYFSFMVRSPGEGVSTSFNIENFEDLVVQCGKNENLRFSELTISQVLNYGKQNKLEDHIDYEKTEKELSRKDLDVSSKPILENTKLSHLCKLYKLKIEHMCDVQEKELNERRAKLQSKCQVDYETNMRTYYNEREKFMKKRKREKARLRTQSRKSGRSSAKSSARSASRSPVKQQRGKRVSGRKEPSETLSIEAANEALKNLKDETFEREEPVLKTLPNIDPPYIYVYLRDFPRNTNEVEALIKHGVQFDAIFNISAIKSSGPPISNESAVGGKKKASGRAQGRKKSVKGKDKRPKKKDENVQGDPTEDKDVTELVVEHVLKCREENIKSSMREIHFVEQEYRDYTYNEETKVFDKGNDIHVENTRILDEIEKKILFIKKQSQKRKQNVPSVDIPAEEVEPGKMVLYKKLLRGFPRDQQSVPVILDCLLQQVVYDTTEKQQQLDDSVAVETPEDQDEGVNKLERMNEIVKRDVNSMLSSVLEFPAFPKPEGEKKNDEVELDVKITSFWDPNDQIESARVIEDKMIDMLWSEFQLLLLKDPGVVKNEESGVSQHEIYHFVGKNEKTSKFDMTKPQVMKELLVLHFKNYLKEKFGNSFAIQERDVVETVVGRSFYRCFFHDFVRAKVPEYLLQNYMSEDGFVMAKFYSIPPEKYERSTWVKQFSVQLSFSEKLATKIAKFEKNEAGKYTKLCVENLTKLKIQLKEQEALEEEKKKKSVKSPEKKKKTGRGKKKKKSSKTEEPEEEKPPVVEVKEIPPPVVKDKPIETEEEALKLIESTHTEVAEPPKPTEQTKEIVEEKKEQKDIFITSVNEIACPSRSLNQRYTFEGKLADLKESMITLYPYEFIGGIITLLVHELSPNAKNVLSKRVTCSVDKEDFSFGFRLNETSGKCFFSTSFNDGLVVCTKTQEIMLKKQSLLKKLDERIESLKLKSEQLNVDIEELNKKKAKKSPKKKKDDREVILQEKTELVTSIGVEIQELEKKKYFSPPKGSSSVNFGFRDGMYVNQDNNGTIVQMQLFDVLENNDILIGTGFNNLERNISIDEMQTKLGSNYSLVEVWKDGKVQKISSSEHVRTVKYNDDPHKVYVCREFEGDLIQLLFYDGSVSTRYNGYWLKIKKDGTRVVVDEENNESSIDLQQLQFSSNTNPMNQCQVFSREDFFMKIIYPSGVEYCKHLDGTVFWTERNLNTNEISRILIIKKSYFLVEVSFEKNTISFESPEHDLVSSTLVPERVVNLTKDENRFYIDSRSQIVDIIPNSIRLYSKILQKPVVSPYGMYSVNFKDGGMKTIDLQGNEFLILNDGRVIIRNKTQMLGAKRDLHDFVTTQNPIDPDAEPFIMKVSSLSDVPQIDDKCRLFFVKRDGSVGREYLSRRLFEVRKHRALKNGFVVNGENELLNENNISASLILQKDKSCAKESVLMKRIVEKTKDRFGKIVDPETILLFHQTSTTNEISISVPSPAAEEVIILRKFSVFREIEPERRTEVENSYGDYLKWTEGRETVLTDMQTPVVEDTRTVEELKEEEKIRMKINQLVNSEKEKTFRDWKKKEMQRKSVAVKPRVENVRTEEEEHVEVLMKVKPEENKKEGGEQEIEKKVQMELKKDKVKESYQYWEEEFSKKHSTAVQKKETLKLLDRKFYETYTKFSSKIVDNVKQEVEKENEGEDANGEVEDGNQSIDETGGDESLNLTPQISLDESKILPYKVIDADSPIVESKVRKKKKKRRMKKKPIGKPMNPREEQLLRMEASLRERSMKFQSKHKKVPKPLNYANREINESYFETDVHLKTKIKTASTAKKLDPLDVPDIHIKPKSLNFGKLKMFSNSKKKSAVITNYGNLPGKFNIKYANNTKKNLKIMYDKGTIAPGMSKKIIFELRPKKKEVIDFNLRITTEGYVISLPIKAEIV